MTIKKITMILLAFTILFLIAPAVQATDYAALKTAYVNSHPGQAIVPFPWEPSTSIKVLPFNYEIPAAPGNNFSIIASRNQYGSASFIITAQKDLSGITINVPNLYNSQGNSIPAEEINVRTVKVWYQASANDVWVGTGTPEYYLTPELLLKDDSLVKVDYVTKTNYLKVTINGVEQYIDISNPTATFPSNAQIHDASSLQPFSLKANENKQIWLTVHVPDGTPAGDYFGNITLTIPSESLVVMNFRVTVLPFDLEAPPIEYAMYYRGIIPPTPIAGISEWKTPQQYTAEMQNMKEHGVLYPTVYSWYDDKVGTELSIRNQIGLPKDHIYLLNIGSRNSISQVIQWKNITAQYGYTDTYVYGIDEARGAALQAERPAWQAIHNAGAKIFVCCYNDAVTIVGDLLDAPVLAGPLNTAQAAQWHSLGKRIFSYANPQVGIENPEIYRKNYGFTLWNAGYDGAMNYAYQHAYGQIWNDYDSASEHYRDHVFAYPTTDGVIDTIQWEGWREGVDDTRYVASLIKKDGSTVSAKTIVSAGLANNENMTTIRKKVIDQVLLSSPASPVAAFTGTPTSGTYPLTVSFTDTSTNTPMSWNWSFGDGSLVNATVKNPVHTYTVAGNYTVSLKATNTAGSNTLTRTNYITVTAAPAAPIANFTT